MSEQKQNWEEEFDKKFVEEEICDSIIFVKIANVHPRKIKAFIQSLLSKALTEAEGITTEHMSWCELKCKNPDNWNKDFSCNCGAYNYNLCRSHVSKIKKKYLN